MIRIEFGKSACFPRWLMAVLRCGIRGWASQVMRKQPELAILLDTPILTEIADTRDKPAMVSAEMCSVDDQRGGLALDKSEQREEEKEPDRGIATSE